MTKFGTGNKVRVAADTFSYYGSKISKDRLGSVAGSLNIDPTWVLVEFSDGYDKYIHQDSLELVVETTVISFDDVKRGDRIRYTRKYSDDNILIREFVVGSISKNYIDSQAMLAASYSVERSSVENGGGTLELLSRPQEDLKVGDVVSTLEDFKRLKHDTVVRSEGFLFIVDATHEEFLRRTSYSFRRKSSVENSFEIVFIP